MSNTEKLKALKLTIDKIDKDYGKGSVMMMNERSQEPMEVISTGSIGLDSALGIGGLPKGRIIEIYGPESSGKTTVAIHVIAEAQKKLNLSNVPGYELSEQDLTRMATFHLRLSSSASHI